MHTHIRKSTAIEALLGGCVGYLEKCPGVARVTIGTTRSPASPSSVRTWETHSAKRVQPGICRFNGSLVGPISVSLPDDLAALFDVTDGISVTWSTRFTTAFDPSNRDGFNQSAASAKDSSATTEAGALKDNLTRLGCIHVNPVEKLSFVIVKGYAYLVGHVKSLHGYELPPGPAFQIHDIGNNLGIVCLIYPLPSHIQTSETPVILSTCQVWFHATRTQKWYFLANSFSSYFRMAVTHLGIRGWQLLYTDFGVPQELLDWLGFYSPAQAKVALRVRAYILGAACPEKGGVGTTKDGDEVAHSEEVKKSISDSEWDLDRTFAIIRGRREKESTSAAFATAVGSEGMPLANCVPSVKKGPTEGAPSTR
ncbi:hypothetical protein BC830DRAFT_1171041 [Chytriomyces sp. MP71]|nr:hypothetical protein BC830DRAFT_1171041 [Chytriomyces sp. MP71]